MKPTLTDLQGRLAGNKQLAALNPHLQGKSVETCFCKFSDAWRCAVAQQLTDRVSCPCPCHRRHRPESETGLERVETPKTGQDSGNHENNTHSQVSNSKPKRHQKAALGEAVCGEEESLPRARVRFIGYRVKPLDPDNFAGSVKDLLDGLRHAGLIHGDEPWRIILETEQVCVHSYAQEKTVIHIIQIDS